jgi:hypothetical protein
MARSPRRGACAWSPGVFTAAAACARPVPLDLFVAPILLGAEPAGRPLAATLTLVGPPVVAFGDGAGDAPDS